MAKIIYSPIGKPKKSSSKPLKKPSATIYVGNSIKRSNKLRNLSLMVNAALLIGPVIYWCVHK